MITSNENLSRKAKRGEQMPIKEENLILSLINSETGEELYQVDGLQNISFNKESKTNYVFDYEKKTLLSFADSPTFTLSFNTPIDTSNLMLSFGADIYNAQDKCNFQIIKVKQTRKHKKKRINKKWIKRYGYKQILVDCKGWKLKTHTDETYEFVK